MAFQAAQRRLALNLAPVEIADDAVLQVGLQPYDRDRLERLRDEGRGTYFVKRYLEQDAIACVSLDEAYRPEGKVVDLPCADAPWLVASLVLEALLRFFHDNHRPVLGYKPLRVVTKRPEDELLRRVPVKDAELPRWLERRISYVFDTRTIYPDQKAAQVGLACDVRVANIIRATAADLLALGIPLVGRYVQVREQGPDARLWPKLRLVGRVAGVRGSGADARLVLDDHAEDVETVCASEAYLEPRHEHVAACLRHLLPDAAEQIILRAEAAAVALRTGKEQVRLTSTMFDVLRDRELALAPGVPFRLGPLLRHGKPPWFPRAEDMPRPVFVLDPSGTRTDTWHQRGLDTSGPYDRRTFTPKVPQIAVICQASAQGQVEQWLTKFLDGMPDVTTGGKGRETAPYERGFVRRYHLQDAKSTTFTTLTPTPRGTPPRAGGRWRRRRAAGPGGTSPSSRSTTPSTASPATTTPTSSRRRCS